MDSNDGMRCYVDVSVDDGDDLIDMHCEDDGNTAVKLRLTIEEVDDIMASLADAREAALAARNS